MSVGKASTRFGFLHGTYGAFSFSMFGILVPLTQACVVGLGAMASPLISTQFSHMKHWSFVYLVHIGLLVITVTMQAITFKFQSQEGACHSFGYPQFGSVLTISTACAIDIGLPPPAQEPDSLLERYKRVFRLRVVHLMALFAFIYVGIEVSIGSTCPCFVVWKL